jgi:flavin reductase (DIM6/NTAB) family NADH-FMN oxidoreductase RutF
VSIDPQTFRGILGNFATGVTVITVADGDEMQGMTANAFTSLSLDPLMVLICVDRASHTHRVLQGGRAFAVNVLSSDQENVSRLFAKKAPPERGTLRGEKFRIGETGAPVLTDCLAYIECRVAEELSGGDHTIFLGEVVDAAVVKDGNPLLFFRGSYRELA